MVVHGVSMAIRPVAKNFQVGVLSLRVLGPDESEARKVEGDGVLGEGVYPSATSLGCQWSAVTQLTSRV